jgi:hypothetical protein
VTRVRNLVVGALLGILVWRIVGQLEERVALYLLALFLSATGAVYPGAALADPTRKSGPTEVSVFVLMFAASVAGLVASPVWLAVGYAAHGLWDVFHEPHRVGAKIVKWFPPLCLSFDLVVAAFVLAHFAR